MKKSRYLIVLILLFYTCKETSTETTPTNGAERESKTMVKSPLEGNWEMIGYYNYIDNKIVDSFKTSKGFRQVKMYNRNKVMWSKLVPTDSTEWFGYGTYEATDSTLTEVMEYGSRIMNIVISEQKEFNYKLYVFPDKYSQIQVDEDGNKVYAENYKRID